MSDLTPEMFQQLMGESGGVRTAWVSAPTMQALVDALAATLAEHLADNDELHVTFNAMQSGWEQHPGRAGTLFKDGSPEWTELHFVYSAFVVMRPRAAVLPPLPPAPLPPSE